MNFDFVLKQNDVDYSELRKKSDYVKHQKTNFLIIYDHWSQPNLAGKYCMKATYMQPLMCTESRL